MNDLTAVLLGLIVIGLPTLMIMLVAQRFFKFREKKLEVEAMHAAEKAAHCFRVGSFHHGFILFMSHEVADRRSAMQ